MGSRNDRNNDQSEDGRRDNSCSYISPVVILNFNPAHSKNCMAQTPEAKVKYRNSNLDQQLSHITSSRPAADFDPAYDFAPPNTRLKIWSRCRR